MSATDSTLGLYVSVPFCRGKCTFCNFASDAFPADRMDPYVSRLVEEVRQARGFAQARRLRTPNTVDTLFFGGGTPTLLSPSHIDAVFAALRESFPLVADAEVTVEAAPGQIEDDTLEAMLRNGVNRMSLGVQSFVDREAKAVGRTHTAAHCMQEIARLRSAGMANLNVDLIAGLPHQTPQSWAESLDSSMASGVEHVSVYMLEVDEESNLGRELIGPGVRYGAPAAPPEAMVADLYAQACETLDRAGWKQYEVSNFAREGYESKHNMKYWTRAPYLGFGLDAHSMLYGEDDGMARRFANADELDAYERAGFADREVERIDALAAWEESIFLGLRLIRGVSLSGLRSQHPAYLVAAFEETARSLTIDGLMTIDGNRAALTAKGRVLSSSVFGELLARDLETAS